ADTFEQTSFSSYVCDDTKRQLRRSRHGLHRSLTYGLEPEGLIRVRRRADDGDKPCLQFNHEYRLFRSAKMRPPTIGVAQPADQLIRDTRRYPCAFTRAFS